MRWRFGLAIWLGLAGGLWAAEEKPLEVAEKVPLEPRKPTVVKVPERDREPGIWLMQFEYNGFRYVPVRIPGQGRKLIMYLTYRVTNWDKEPHLFVPEFELVLNDLGTRYRDKIVPAALGPIRILEAPVAGTGVLHDFKNSVDIVGPVQPNLETDVDHSVYGVVTFEEVDLASDSFTLYVKGLSNGIRRVTDEKTGRTRIEHKTLKIDFVKLGDDYAPDAQEISLGKWEYVYR